jgi:hypothetical protein
MDHPRVKARPRKFYVENCFMFQEVIDGWHALYFSAKTFVSYDLIVCVRTGPQQNPAEVLKLFLWGIKT